MITPIIIMNIHAEKVQQDGSASGLGDSINAVCIVWVIAWVRRRFYDSTSCGEVSSISTFIDHVAPNGGRQVCRFIFELKSKATHKGVGDESGIIC